MTLWAFQACAEMLEEDVQKSIAKAIPMEVFVNGRKTGTWPVLKQDDAIFAPRNAFEAWRVPLEKTSQVIQFKGQDYVSLTSIAGFSSKENIANQSIDVEFSPNVFTRTELGIPMPKQATIGHSEPSLFLNYDLNYQASQTRNSASTVDLGLLSEFGFSSNLGLLTSSAVGRNMTGNTAQGSVARSLVRLETTFTADFAHQKQSLVLGDTVTRASSMGSSVYFGGIRFGSNYALAPGFIRQAVPLLSGVSVVPSTVNLYVDGVLRQTSNIPVGPFVVDNSPLLIGSGEARLVVRDLLGRETVITRSFLSSNKLLGTNLDDWSVEAGRLRQNLGVTSGSYGEGFMRGLWHHGYNETLTLEGVAQSTQTYRSLGLGVASIVTDQWLGSAAMTSSHVDKLGEGSQWLLGLERQDLHRSIFLQVQGASIHFRELGQPQNIEPIKLQLIANATYASDRLGAFGAGITSTRTFKDLSTHTLMLNYSIPVGQRSALNISISRSKGQGSGTSIGMSLVLPLDHDRMINASTTRSQKQNDFYVSAMQNPTQNDSLGWRLLTGQQQSIARSEGGVSYLGRYGNLKAEVSTSNQQSAVRISESGALVITDGHLFATQNQNQSFALVQVLGYGDVGAGLGNQTLTRTDESGVALIPHLAPHQRNSVRLNPHDLPPGAEIDSLEQIAVPARRSVVKVIFPVRTGRAALLKIQLEDGSLAPAGATVHIENEEREFYVARRGEAFVTGLQTTNVLWLQWKTKKCALMVDLPSQMANAIPRIGPLTCRETLQ
jgi:outer membrane usher protein